MIRILPFLIAGFGLFSSLGFLLIIAGFLIQDRFDLAASPAATLTGLALGLAGIGVILSQAVAVPRLKWTPQRLLTVGAIGGFLGFAGLVPTFPAWFFCAAMFVAGFGIGLAAPGFTAGPTLHFTTAEQGGVAGLVAATTALTFVFAPTISTTIYAIDSRLPLIVGMAFLAAVAVFVALHPGFRRSPDIVSSVTP